MAGTGSNYSNKVILVEFVTCVDTSVAHSRSVTGTRCISM